MSNRNESDIVADEEDVFCPLLNKKINWGYCWELCNIGTDDILLRSDRIDDWDEAQKICEECGRYND